MDGSLSILALSRQDEQYFSKLKGLFAEKTGLKDESIAFSFYDDPANLVKSLRAAFASSAFVMVCADPGYFLRFKGDIFKVMNLKTEISESIESAIEILAPDTPSDIRNAHAEVARGAKVFLTDDGLFSSFALESGQDRLIIGPCDLYRLEASLELGLSDYIIKSESTLPSFDFAPLNSLIWAQGLKIAVANSKNSNFLRLRFKEAKTSELSFSYLDLENINDKSEPKLLTANQAKSVRELNNSDIGLAISDIYISKKDISRSYAFVALASADGAKVVKVHSKPGESPRLLVRAAVDSLLAELASFSGLSKSLFKNPQEEKADKKRAFKISVSAIIALILSLIIILMGSKITNAAKEYFDKLSVTQEAYTETFSSDPEATEDSTGEISLDSTDELISSVLDSSATDNSSTTGEGSFLSSVLTTIVNTSLAGIIATMPSFPSTTSLKETTKAGTSAGVGPSQLSTTATTKPTTSISTAVTTTTTTNPASTNNPSIGNGTFSFTTKGYGHGVGFSQEGAKAMANSGKNYVQILEHYFPGSKVIDDPEGWPEYINYGGAKYSVEEYLIRTTVQEIGASSPLESLKAQAVAAYNFAKMNGFDVSRSQSAFSDSFNLEKDKNANKLIQAIQSVRNKYLVCNNQLVQAYYFASSAGKTVSSSSVWGGKSPSYLVGGVSSPETISIVTKTFTVSEIKNLVAEYNAKNPDKKILLGDSPGDWIRIIRTDSVGYVEEMKLGNQTMSGNHFRFYVMQLKIRSHSFTYTYSS